MPQTNITDVTIYDKSDLTQVTSLNNDDLHVTEGKKISKADLIEDLGISETNLSQNPSALNIEIVNSNGLNTTLNPATSVHAGLMTAQDRVKLSGIEDNASADQSPADIKAALETLTGANRLNASAIAGLPTGGTDDQTASEVSVTPTGNLTSTNVQAALVELQTELDGVTSSSVPFIKQTFISNRVKIWGKAGAITYSEAVANEGQLTIAEFGDISHASIPIIDGVNYTASGDFTLRITFSDNSVNTWTPVANDITSINDQDIYIPKMEAYNYNLPFFTGAKEVNQLNSGTTPVIPSSITWDVGTLVLTFTDSSSFGGNDKIILQLDFPKL